MSSIADNRIVDTTAVIVPITEEEAGRSVDERFIQFLFPPHRFTPWLETQLVCVAWAVEHGYLVKEGDGSYTPTARYLKLRQG